jgi:hypothetical protein
MFAVGMLYLLARAKATRQASPPESPASSLGILKASFQDRSVQTPAAAMRIPNLVERHFTHAADSVKQY